MTKPKVTVISCAHCVRVRPVAKVVDGCLEIKGIHGGVEHVTRIVVEMRGGLPVVVDETLAEGEEVLDGRVVKIGRGNPASTVGG